MKTNMKYLFVSVILAVLITVAFPMTALAGENKTYFTGTECYGGPIDPGVWTPLGNGQVHISGLRSFHYDQTDDPRMTGVDSIVLNAVGDPVAGYGTFWGTSEIVTGEGSWEGQFVGKQESGQFTFNALLHGHGGYEGLVANWNYSPGDVVCGVLSGYIVETGAGE
jgi:hypothetical protein